MTKVEAAKEKKDVEKSNRYKNAIKYFLYISGMGATGYIGYDLLSDCVVWQK